jgi:hypothetical protein
MFWPMRIGLRIIWRLRWLLAAAAAGFGAGTLMQLRGLQNSWGLDLQDVGRGLPGDDLVAPAGLVDTRSLVIDAPPSEVWPWLVQMGHERGGWYGYERMDMTTPSASTIRPEFQDLASGDLVPLFAGGGLEVRLLEPDEALVLYLDTPGLRAQLEAAAAADGELTHRRRTRAGRGPRRRPRQAGQREMPEFRASWSFVLEPEPGDRTRLVERLRVWAADAGGAGRVGLPALDLGFFIIMRKHMLGLAERAEDHHRAASSSAAADGTGPSKSAPGD